MLALRELQGRFAAALFDGAPEAVTPWVRADGLNAAERVSIYRNNLHECFIKALALEFPVIQRLVGVGYFRQLALSFLADHPSRSGDLHHIGEPLAAFLHRRFRDTPYDYLRDVAALEWAEQEVAVADDATPLDLTSLRAVAPDQLAGLRFELHPACRLVSSEYPILRIWSVNQPGAVAEEPVDLGAGPDFVLVRRGPQGVEFRRLPRADFVFVNALACGSMLGEALEQAQAIASDFNVADVLKRLLGLRVLTGIRRFNPHPGAST